MNQPNLESLFAEVDAYLDPEKTDFVWSNLVMGINGSFAVGDTSVVLSGPEDRALMKHYQSKVDVVLIGGETIRSENPGIPKGARLAVLSRDANFADDLQMFQGDEKPIVISPSTKADTRFDSLTVDTSDPKNVVSALGELGCSRILLEAGPNLSQSFAAAGALSLIHI